MVFANVVVAMTMGYSSLKACHEGDGALNKEHYKWKNVGIFQYTENITILTITSTSCDLYTAYLETQYDIIRSRSHRERANKRLGSLLRMRKAGSSLIRKTLFANYDTVRFKPGCRNPSKRSSISSKPLPRSVSPAASTDS